MILSRLAALFVGPNAGIITSVTSSASDGLVLPKNGARKGAAFFNDSTALLYLALGPGVSSSSAYTVQIGPSGYYELPVCQGGVYLGEVRGIWASANGSLRVTEFV